MVLSHLQIKDLTRALTVSKRWQKSILGSLVLRRILFLDPNPRREYLGDRFVVEQRKWVATIHREPQRGRRLVVEPHPAILGFSNRNSRQNDSRAHTHFLSCDHLQTVPASTFLCQPPVNEATIWCRSSSMNHLFKSVLRCAGGLTFGSLLKHTKSLRVLRIEHCEEVTSWWYGDEGEEFEKTFDFLTRGAIAANDPLVEEARMKAASSTKPNELDTD